MSYVTGVIDSGFAWVGSEALLVCHGETVGSLDVATLCATVCGDSP